MRIGILLAGSRQTPVRQHPSYQHRGFTLLEILVVLVIIGFAYSLVPPMFSSGVSGIEMKAAARKVVAGLRKAKSQAVIGRKPVALTLNIDTNSFIIGIDKRSYQLPESIDVKLEVAEIERVGIAGGAVRFYPDSTSTGGRVTLSAEGAAYMIDVDWLTGKVTIL